MGSRFLSKIPVNRASSLRSFGQLEERADSFLRLSVCRRSLSYTTSTSSLNHFPWPTPKIQKFRGVNNALLLRQLNVRRLKSGRAQAKQKNASETRQLGDEPPLYDGKPAFWARWVFLLLAVDILFTGLSVDMVMQKWTRLVETPPASSSSQDASSSQSSDKKYELRPLWQRLGLASFEIMVGIAAGALILASRDRTVWRLRVRRVPISTLPPGRAGMRLPPTASSDAQTINVLALETGSGRTKRFLLRDCVLMPGRDLSELLLSIGGIRGRFMVPINGARVLGVTADNIGESNVLKELLASKVNEADVALINSTPGGADLENAHLAELRRGLAQAWVKIGGTLSVPKFSPQKDGWTSGPVTEGAR